MKPKDRIGLKYGSLTVIEVGRKTPTNVYLRCRCKCGLIDWFWSSNLTTGQTKHCGKCTFMRQRAGRAKAARKT